MIGQPAIAIDASEYETQIRKTLPYYETFYSEIIDLVKAVRPDVKVWLDTGCGTGMMVKTAFRHFPGVEFQIADPSERTLAKGEARLTNILKHQLTTVGAFGSEALPLDGDSRPDVITAVLAHHYLDDDTRAEATQRCYELLAPGGLYITVENLLPDTSEGLDIAMARWRSYQLSQGRSNSAVTEDAELLNKAYFPIKRQAHIDLLRQAGFQVAEMFWLSHLQGGFFAIK